MYPKSRDAENSIKVLLNNANPEVKAEITEFLRTLENGSEVKYFIFQGKDKKWIRYTGNKAEKKQKDEAMTEKEGEKVGKDSNL